MEIEPRTNISRKQLKYSINIKGKACCVGCDISGTIRASTEGKQYSGQDSWEISQGNGFHAVMQNVLEGGNTSIIIHNNGFISAENKRDYTHLVGVYGKPFIFVISKDPVDKVFQDYSQFNIIFIHIKTDEPVLKTNIGDYSKKLQYLIEGHMLIKFSEISKNKIGSSGESNKYKSSTELFTIY